MNCAFIQARQTSLRFNNKIFSKIDNYTIIEWIYLRLKKSKKLNNIFFLIPKNKKNEDLKNFLEKKKYNYITGPEHNVLKRFYIGSKIVKPKKIIRIFTTNKVNKRSFAISDKRFIPPHQYLMAKSFLNKKLTN